MAQCITERVTYGTIGDCGRGFITVGDSGQDGVTIRIRPHVIDDEGSPILLSRDKAIRIAAEILRAIA